MPITNKLRPFDDISAKAAPSEPGVYELLYRGTVVYIGSSSTSIRSRITSHRNSKHKTKVTHFRCKVVQWPDEAIELEAKLCKAFSRKNGGKPPRLQKRMPVNRDIFDWI